MRFMTSSVPGIAAFMCALTAGCSMMNQHHASAAQTQHAPHLDGKPILVETRNGHVEIVADTGRSDVEITATITCVGSTQEEADQRIKQATFTVARGSDDTLVIKPVFPDAAQEYGDGASFAVRIPDARGVTVKTSNGKVTVQNLSGALAVETSNGAIHISDFGGSANLKTSNGPISVSHLDGSLTARSSNGGIEAAGIAGSADLHSSNAPITVELNGDQAGPLHATSSNGPVKATVGKAFAGTVRVATSNGSITIGDPSGRIKTRNISDKQGTLTIGEGGAESVIETSNGGITLKISG